MKSYILSILTCLTISSVSAQDTENDLLDSLLNEFLSEDEDLLSLFDRAEKYQFLYASSNYRSNTFFAGRELTSDQFNLSNQISYFHSNGISVAVAGILYQGFEPRYNTTIVSAGYSKSLDQIEGLRLRASYDRYFFAQIDSVEESSFNSSLNLGASYRFGKFRTRANFSLLLGNETSSQFNWNLAGYFDIWKASPIKKLRFEPAISFLFGSETVLSTTTVEGLGRFANTFTETTELDKYGLLNTQLRLPLSLTYNNFDFEVGYNYNLPRSLGDDSYSNTSFFNITVGYLINLNKRKK